MPLITGGILRPPAGAPTWSNQGGNQGWVDFFRNQFAQAPRYPIPRPAAGAGRFGYMRAMTGIPVGTRTLAPGAADVTTLPAPPARRPPAAIANPGAGVIGQYLFPSGTSRTLRHPGTTVPPGGVPGTPGLPPPVPVEGPPAVLGPPAWQPYLSAFMRGYMNP
jgi:hypothetical protein